MTCWPSNATGRNFPAAFLLEDSTAPGTTERAAAADGATGVCVRFACKHSALYCISITVRQPCVSMAWLTFRAFVRYILVLSGIYAVVAFADALFSAPACGGPALDYRRDGAAQQTTTALSLDHPYRTSHFRAPNARCAAPARHFHTGATQQRWRLSRALHGFCPRTTFDGCLACCGPLPVVVFPPFYRVRSSIWTCYIMRDERRAADGLSSAALPALWVFLSDILPVWFYFRWYGEHFVPRNGGLVCCSARRCTTIHNACTSSFTPPVALDTHFFWCFVGDLCGIGFVLSRGRLRRRRAGGSLERRAQDEDYWRARALTARGTTSVLYRAAACCCTLPARRSAVFSHSGIRHLARGGGTACSARAFTALRNTRSARTLRARAARTWHAHWR